MCQRSIVLPAGRQRLEGLALGVFATLIIAGAAVAQRPGAPHPDWRHIGNSVVGMALAAPASGPVERLWYSPDGSRLYVRTAAGTVFETADFEKWQPSPAAPPAADPNAAAALVPGGTRGVRAAPTDGRRLYAYGEEVLRADDGGRAWANVTAFGGRSIIGGDIHDLAVSPLDSEEVVAANENGVWRSLDGGASWTGLNETLPNFPARRMAALPQGTEGLRVVAGALGVLEWAPGEKQAWRRVQDAAAAQDAGARSALSQTLGVEITALATAGDYSYAGSADGRLWVSSDKARTWISTTPAGRGPVEATFADAREPRQALAALS